MSYCSQSELDSSFDPGACRPLRMSVRRRWYVSSTRLFDSDTMAQDYTALVAITSNLGIFCYSRYARRDGAEHRLCQVPMGILTLCEEDYTHKRSLHEDDGTE